APEKLVGLKRQSATLLASSGHPAALITYGQGLGGIAVIELTADAGNKQPSRTTGENGRLARPAGKIRGRDGQEPDPPAGPLEGVSGFVEAPTLYPYLSGRRNLELLAAFDGGGAASRIEQALDVVELTHRQRDRVGGYSHGMRQRLRIAAALLRDPRLLLLDE